MRRPPSVFLLLMLTYTTHLPAASKPLFDSKLVTSAKPNHSVEIDVEIRGAKQLFLIVTDGGNGYGCDWADWAEPRLVGPKGELKLTDLKWKKASTDWGQVHVGRNAGGGALSINGQPVKYGIGTHANSVIHFELPAGYERFKARGGLDNGGTNQGDGTATSVRFLVFAEQPPATLLASGAAADAASRDAKDALDGLTVGDGLEATMFAAEPIMANPTNIDIDHLGRVWVCEVLNYRRFRNKDFPERVEGDRILILEDTDLDGSADRVDVFYQGKDVNSAHGICVLDNRVLISCADKVFFLIDDDRDLKADRKEVLFTGISGTEHDHGIHAFVFGPDGKLYFNFGNAGKQIKDRDGKPIVDLAGNEVNDSRRPYQEGMVFRCNMDGSQFETLGWNFRNNWEVCVDSFGTLWQSDNDDDGNRGTRINFVMEFGNYGYKDERTGAGWRDPRTGMHEDIPKRHWHLNDPGVVPNLLQTGAGSPTGILCYEGDLLPEVFHGAPIHCDAGPNIVRAYPVKKYEAGYSADIIPVLEGTTDKWFRPSDVCVAPDGSLIIADWYDPGVGGHRMQDIDRGRLFRVAPPGLKYTVPKVDVSTVDGAIAALKSPNHATRYLAWTALKEFGVKAKPALQTMFESDPNPRFRARAMWLLAYQTEALVAQTAIRDDDPDIRIAGLRLARTHYRPSARSLNTDAMSAYIAELIDDPNAQVRRECAIALSEFRNAMDGQRPAGDAAKRFHFHRKSEMWAELASRYEGQDRWSLEALGIAARADWNACLDAWLEKVGDNWNTPAGRDIVWRSRAAKTPELLREIISDPSVPADEMPRYFRALDFLSGSPKDNAILQIAFAGSLPEDRRSFVLAEAINRLPAVDLNGKPEYRDRLNQVLDDIAGTSQFLKLVDRFNAADRYGQVLTLAQQKPTEQIGVEAIRLLLAKKHRKPVRAALTGDDLKQAEATATALATSGDGRATSLLLEIANDADRPLSIRRISIGGATKTQNGAKEVLALVTSKKLDASLQQAVAQALHASTFRPIKEQAQKLFPLPPTKDNKPLPPIDQLEKMRGNVQRGRLVFNTTGTCMKCHVVNGIGREVGPNLSEIGKKLSRQAMIQSILYPSAGVSHNYETYAVVLDSGNSVTGLMVSDTAESVSIKGNDAIVRTFQRSEIDEIIKQNVSLMPADLQKVMTAQEMIDVVEYMLTLKVAKTPGAK